MNTEIYHFPTNSTGGLFCYNTDSQRIYLGTILPPAKVDINVELSESDLFNAYCTKCSAYISSSKVFNSLHKKVLKIKNAEPTFEQMEKLIDDFYLKTNKCKGVHADTCKFNYFNNCLVTLNTPELTLLKRVWPSRDSSEPSDGRWGLFFQKSFNTSELNKYYPYCIGNVYSDGSICWGKDIEKPFDHAQAVQDFFGSSFNADLQLEHFWFGEYNDNGCDCSTNCDCDEDDYCDCSLDCDCDNKVYDEPGSDETYHEWFESGYQQHIYEDWFSFNRSDFKYYREDAKGLIIFKESGAHDNFKTEDVTATFAWIVDQDDSYYLLEMPNTRHSSYTEPQILLYHKSTGVLGRLEKSKESIK